MTEKEIMRRLREAREWSPVTPRGKVRQMSTTIEILEGLIEVVEYLLKERDHDR